ncbi:MAG: hypothetical protein ACLGIC_04940 [Acidimicrobiia bacterium]
MTSPTPTTRPGLQYPTRTKVIIVAVLAVAISLLVLAYLSTADSTETETQVTGGGTAERDPDGVDARIPRDGAQILGQEQIGIDLAAGWTGELVLQPLSNDQAVPLPEDELERDELNRITYRPGPGKAIERLSGDYCVLATIWDQVQGREATQRTETWCFSAT